MSEMVGRLINNYEILSLIGEGGMGSVYLARHPVIGRQSAIKVLRPELTRDPSLVQRFMNEARAANAIRHPHLIDIIDVGTLPDGTPYLMMEYLEGESLCALLEREQKLSIGQAIEITCQAASALEAAHQHGIVHRDLKPDNLFLLPGAGAPFGVNLKVLDFGIAKLAGQLANSLKTCTGMIMGTPIYMSPEQCRGISDAIDRRSDIYSLGIILYHMICARPPFVSTGAGEIMGMHMFGELPKPSTFAPDIPPALERVLLRALAREPAARYPSMADLETELRTVDLSGQAPAKSETLPIPPSSTDRLPRRTTQTTLSAAVRVGSVRNRKDGKTKSTRKGWNRGLTAGATAVIVAAVLGGFVVVRSKNKASSGTSPEPAARALVVVPPAAPPLPPPTPAVVTLSIATTPAGAKVTNVESGEILGSTPYQSTFPLGQGTMRITVEKLGYQSESRTLSLAQDQRLDLVLAKESEKRPGSKPRKPRAIVDRDGMRKL